MKQKNNNLKIIKLILSLTLCAFTSACYECYSDACWQKKERARFLSLSPEQQRKEREECKKWVPVSCYTYSEPTSEELKKTH
jgi:hypothetical protein